MSQLPINQDELLRDITQQPRAASVYVQEKTYLETLQEATEAEKLAKFKNENNAREEFRINIFTVTVVWMFFILLIVIACGQQVLTLSDTVLVTLITTTTANVFGFLYVVVNYLFNKDKST